MNTVDPKYYIHPEDRQTLEALKGLPGFQQLLKAFMKEWSEKYARMIHMSGCVRISRTQMPEYYEMLEGVCEKLGIEVPELYLERNVVPNAYTSGDTKPFIVLTSGLVETLPKELIPTILAHECGHIACRHVLYRTMGTLLFNGTISALSILIPFGAVISLPLEIAFYNWMRASEYSADRAAVLCDGSADRMIEVCMRLAGFDGEMSEEAKEAFLEQAREYETLAQDSARNKSIEFLLLRRRTHPFTAVRALECVRWASSEQYQHILDGTITDADLEEETVVEEEPEEDRKNKGLFDLDLGNIELPKIDLPKFDLNGLWGKKKEEPEEAEDLTPIYRQLRELKELVKEGIITEEDYEAKKKKLLDI